MQLGMRITAYFDIRCPNSLIRKMRSEYLIFLLKVDTNKEKPGNVNPIISGLSTVLHCFSTHKVILGEVASYSRTSVFLSVKWDNSGLP